MFSFLEREAKKVLRKVGWHTNKYQREEVRRIAKDVISISTLPDLDAQYLPWTKAALRPAAVSALLNEIVIHKRKKILEIGSGISTVYIAKIINESKKIISIEEDKGWCDTVRNFIKEEGVSSSKYEIIHSPLNEIDESTPKWYDREVLGSALEGKRFDMLFVDGPPADSKETRHDRYPALPFLSKYLGKEFVVFLDDAKRGGEKEVVREWEKEFSLERSYSAGMAVFRPPESGKTFDII